MSDDTVSHPAWTIDDHLRGKPEASIALFDAFVELVAACGPYTVSVSKSSITFKGTRRGFAGARPDARGLKGYLDLQRRVADPRISGAAPYESRLFVHHYRVAEPAELDETFAGWLREAYAVGQGEHLTRPR
ncbi:DUF5655 domain-containing protein [Luteimicrobium sp. DT211]|uniref:DUF5655 domain-containing protein n=1 Tax=Luteimicrobium sp. DT211 TaxID=3393412 RepID=UPI003CF1B1CE